MSDEPTNWELISYDVWGDEDGGYHVNDSFRTGRVVQIDDYESDIDVIKTLVDAGILTHIDDDESIDVDGDEQVMWLTDVNTNYPICELRITDAAPTVGGVQ